MRPISHFLPLLHHQMVGVAPQQALWDSPWQANEGPSAEGGRRKIANARRANFLKLPKLELQQKFCEFGFSPLLAVQAYHTSHLLTMASWREQRAEKERVEREREEAAAAAKKQKLAGLASPSASVPVTVRFSD